MHLHLRRSLVMLCTLGLLLGSLSAALGGANPAIAATPSGGVYAWGDNSNGQLGNGTTTNSSTPVVITLAPAVTAATAVAAGQDHSLAVGSDGKVYAWGFNGDGQLGTGTTTDSHTPVLVNPPTGLTATAIAAGGFHSLAIGSDGNAYAWGSNLYGQLGNGTTADSHTPVAIALPPGTTPLTLGTGSGSVHSLAILTSSSAPTAAILSRFHAVHAGGATLFHWRVASGAGVRGFFLTAGTHRLNRRLIAVNAHRQSYTYRSRWQGHGPYLLHGILQGGAVVTLASTG